MAPAEWPKKKPWAYPALAALVERALDGAAPELQLIDRLEALLTASERFSHSTLVDLFFTWWGLDGAEGLHRWFGDSTRTEFKSRYPFSDHYWTPASLIVAETAFLQDLLLRNGIEVEHSFSFSKKQSYDEWYDTVVLQSLR